MTGCDTVPHLPQCLSMPTSATEPPSAASFLIHLAGCATGYPTEPAPDPSAPAQTDTKYIAFHEGGFLQVAVSEALRPQSIPVRTDARRGAQDSALRLSGTEASSSPHPPGIPAVIPCFVPGQHRPTLLAGCTLPLTVADACR